MGGKLPFEEKGLLVECRKNIWDARRDRGGGPTMCPVTTSIVYIFLRLSLFLPFKAHSEYCMTLRSRCRRPVDSPKPWSKFPTERETKVTFPEEIWMDNKYSCVKDFCVHVFLSLLHNKTNTASIFFSFIASVVAPADLHHCEFLKHLPPSILNHWIRRITDRKEERWRCISTQRMQQLPGKALNVQNDKRGMCKRMGWTGERCGKDVLPILKLFPIIPPVSVKSQHIIKLYLNIWKTTDGKGNGFSVKTENVSTYFFP